MRDNVTGLVWEVKRNDATHLRYKDHKYAWYNPDTTTNGGAVGYQTPTGYFSEDGNDDFIAYTSPTCSGVADVNQCNTQSYVTAVNAAGLCGKKDWRLPTVDELRNLAHSGRTNPSIDTANFPDTASFLYWSSSPDASVSVYAWGVDFYGGYGYYDGKNSANRVRLVRSGQ